MEQIKAVCLAGLCVSLLTDVAAAASACAGSSSALSSDNGLGVNDSVKYSMKPLFVWWL